MSFGNASLADVLNVNTPPLTIITTRLPPQVCGIGTYSWLLNQYWPAQLSNTRFLVIEGARESAGVLNYQSISEFNGKPRALLRELQKIGSSTVFLHYAGRAYHRYGCPVWLPGVVAKWKREFPSARLMIFFHEVPGRLPILSRHYWIDVCNRRVIARLARLADVIVTNTRDQAAKLKLISNRADIHFVPVGSNVPNVDVMSAPRVRTEFVIFGLPFSRWQTLQMFADEIPNWMKQGRLTRLHLIGPSDEKFTKAARELFRPWADSDVVTEHGELSAPAISKLLSRAQFGLVSATTDTWSKSGAFMACASSGCAVVGRLKSDAVPLRWTVSGDEVRVIGDSELNQRTDALKEWYEENADWNVIARRIFELLPQTQLAEKEL